MGTFLKLMVKFNVDKVRKYYTELGVSGSDFGYNCDITRHAWNSIMAGKSNPRLETVYKIANQMKCKVDDLLIVTKFGN